MMRFEQGQATPLKPLFVPFPIGGCRSGEIETIGDVTCLLLSQFALIEREGAFAERFWASVVGAVAFAAQWADAKRQL